MANILKKKLGPLPVWAWGGIGIGGLIAYKLFFASGGAAKVEGGYTTDDLGNVYDANGNLVFAAPGPVAPQTSMGGVGGGGGGGEPPSPLPPTDGGYNAGYIDALEAASQAFGSLGTPATAPAPGPESPAHNAFDVGELLDAVFGSLASPAVQGSATPVPMAAVTTPTHSGGALPRYYTYKNQVPLGPGETLHYTPGRGYYAWPAGMAAPAPPIAPATVAPHSTPNPPSAVVPANRRYYTYKWQVPLGPGQTLHFTPGRGYYAA